MTLAKVLCAVAALLNIVAAATLPPTTTASSTASSSLSSTPSGTATSSPIPSPAPAEEQERDQSLALFLVLSLLTFSFFVSYYLRVKRITAIHETIVGLFAGILVGIVLRLGPGKEVQSLLSFSNTIMLNVLLPPIILASGYDLRQENFFRNFGTILAFALAGTFISAIVIGVLVYLWSLADFTISLSILDCLIFGSTLSATDPVTILSIFNSKKVDPTLYSIIFGESLLNDAVSIVMFETLSKFRGQRIGIYSVFHGIGLFLIVFTVSMALGVAFGLACSLMLKHSRLRIYPQLEGCLVALIAYTSYFFSNAVTMSGIVSLLFCGITLKHYAYHNMSRRTQRSTRYTFQTLASLSENFIFIYLGLSLFTQENLVFRPLFIVVTVASVVFSRYAAVFPIASLVNFLRRLRNRKQQQHPHNRRSAQAGQRQELSREYQIMLFWAGLRGAVGFALSANIVGENALALQTTVLVTIVLTLIAFGGTTGQMLDILGIQTGVQDDEGDSSDEDEGFDGLGMGVRRSGRDLPGRSGAGGRRRAGDVGGSSSSGIKRRGGGGGYSQGLYRDDEALVGSRNGKGQSHRYSYDEDASDTSDVLPSSNPSNSGYTTGSLRSGGRAAPPFGTSSADAGGQGQGADDSTEPSALFDRDADAEGDDDFLVFGSGSGDGGRGSALASSLGGVGGARARALLERGALIMRDGQWFQRIDDRYLKPYFSNAVASRKHQEKRNARMASASYGQGSPSSEAAAAAAAGAASGRSSFAAAGDRDEDGTAALWEAEAAAREPDADVFPPSVLDDDDQEDDGSGLGGGLGRKNETFGRYQDGANVPGSQHGGPLLPTTGSGRGVGGAFA